MRTSPSLKGWQKVAENLKRKPIICKQKCGLRLANCEGQLTLNLPPSSCPLPQYPFNYILEYSSAPQCSSYHHISLIKGMDVL